MKTGWELGSYVIIFPNLVELHATVIINVGIMTKLIILISMLHNMPKCAYFESCGCCAIV